MSLVFMTCWPIRYLSGTCHLPTLSSVASYTNTAMDSCAICKASNLGRLKYRLHTQEGTGGRGKKLFECLRSVVRDKLPKSLCSEFVCQSCRSTVLSAFQQEHSQEESL